MERIKFGKTDLRVSRVAMGGIPIMRVEREDAVTMVRKVIDLGIDFIDTATGHSDSEEKIGEAMEKAQSCTECEECVERCPYDLPIPSLIKKSLAFWDELVGK